MTPPIDESLSRLTTLASKLNSVSDDMNAVIEKLDARLESINLGVSAWDDEILDERVLSVATEEHDGEAHGWIIGYCRLSEGWKLAAMPVRDVARFDRDEPTMPDVEREENGSLISLLKAPRVIRMEAMGRLEHLLDTLAEKAKGYIEGVVEGMRSVETMLTDDPADLLAINEKIAREMLEMLEAKNAKRGSGKRS